MVYVLQFPRTPQYLVDHEIETISQKRLKYEHKKYTASSFNLLTFSSYLKKMGKGDILVLDDIQRINVVSKYKDNTLSGALLYQKAIREHKAIRFITTPNYNTLGLIKKMQAWSETERQHALELLMYQLSALRSLDNTIHQHIGSATQQGIAAAKERNNGHLSKAPYMTKKRKKVYEFIMDYFGREMELPDYETYLDNYDIYTLTDDEQPVTEKTYRQYVDYAKAELARQEAEATEDTTANTDDDGYVDLWGL